MNNILDKYFSDLDSATIQVWIGDMSVNHSSKTVKNAYSLFSAVTEMYYPEMKFKVKLPQRERKNIYVPTDDDVKKIIQYFKETDREMLKATYLAAFGTMRRSELCALTADDVHENVITVNKAIVNH